MLVGDLVYSDDFDVNCNYAIYEGQWSDGNVIWPTGTNGYRKPPCAILDREIAYVTINTETSTLVIEVKDDFSDIDPEAIRRNLEEVGIVNGEVVDPDKLAQSPFIQQVEVDVEKISSTTKEQGEA